MIWKTFQIKMTEGLLLQIILQKFYFDKCAIFAHVSKWENRWIMTFVSYFPVEQFHFLNWNTVITHLVWYLLFLGKKMKIPKTTHLIFQYIITRQINPTPIWDFWNRCVILLSKRNIRSINDSDLPTFKHVYCTTCNLMNNLKNVI